MEGRAALVALAVAVALAGAAFTLPHALAEDDAGGATQEQLRRLRGQADVVSSLNALPWRTYEITETNAPVEGLYALRGRVRVLTIFGIPAADLDMRADSRSYTWYTRTEAVAWAGFIAIELALLSLATWFVWRMP